jgi:ADP-ribose pyrophosphatase YjhB (NUDIX family)
MKYCPECGSLIKIVDNTQIRIDCSKCGFVYYPQLKVGAGAFIEKDNRLLLIKRKHDPFRDTWNIPAGYVNVDERPEIAVVRETQEETGLIVECIKLVSVFFFNDDPRGNGILIIYYCKVKKGIALESDESYSPTFFDRGNIPENLSGGGHNQAIEYWKKQFGRNNIL